MKKLLFVLLLLAGRFAFAQGVLYSDSVYSSAYVYGKQVSVAIPGALMTVCANPAVMSNGVCTNRVPLFRDMGQATMTPNPVTLDGNSNYHFFAAKGTLLQYTITTPDGTTSGPYDFTGTGTPTSSGGGPTVGAAPYAQMFAWATTVTLLGSAHGYGTTSLIVSCYDNESPAHQIQPAQVYVNTSTYDVTVLFAMPQSGFCVVNGGVGPQGATSTSSSVSWNNVTNKPPAFTPSLPTPAAPGGVYMPVACPPVTDSLNGLPIPQHVYAINYATGQLLCSQDNNWDLAVEVNGQAVATGVRAINFVGSAGMQITAASNQATGVVTYTVTGSTATQAQSVTFNPLAGAYFGAQSVTLSCPSPAPTIYYTTNGTTPTYSSNVYASPISMTTGTIEAICASSGLADSNVASSSYSQTAPNATLSASSLTFASLQTGTSSSSYTVGLSNTGNAPLTISSITTSGANAGDFSESNNCGSTLAVNASCTISVVFTPGTLGTRTATLNINDNATNSPQTVSLSGVGISNSATWVPSSAACFLWTNPNGVVSTSSYASIVSSLNDQGCLLYPSGNAPTLPTNVVITGFSFTFTAYASIPASLQVANTNGAPYQNIALTTTPTSYTAGGSTNMWGMNTSGTYTPALFNSYPFEPSFAPTYNSPNGITYYVNNLSVTVYYHF